MFPDRWKSLVAAMGLAGLFAAGCVGFYKNFGDSVETSRARQSIPSRSDKAPTGSQFLQQTSHLLPDDREKMIVREMMSGNMPQYLWHLKPIKLQIKRRGRIIHTGTVWVTPDYLALGSDTDFVRMPMTPMSAQALADRFGFVLPTRKLVDAIYEQSELKIKPSPLRAGPRMTSNAFYEMHQKMIEQHVGPKNREKLIAGHKKDIVVSNILTRRPHRVAIYGWHTRRGKPIQPLSIFHIDSYADYSHGIRFVLEEMEVDGKKRSVAEVMRDPELSKLVSDEGVLSVTRVAEPISISSL